MVTIFVPDAPEFLALIRGARADSAIRVIDSVGGYWRIEADREIRFHRKSLQLGPALWNSALTGGFRGQITEYGRDVMRIVSEDA